MMTSRENDLLVFANLSNIYSGSIDRVHCFEHKGFHLFGTSVNEPRPV